MKTFMSQQYFHLIGEKHIRLMSSLISYELMICKKLPQTKPALFKKAGLYRLTYRNCIASTCEGNLSSKHLCTQAKGW